jgi:hypothetical protein
MTHLVYVVEASPTNLLYDVWQPAHEEWVRSKTKR